MAAQITGLIMIELDFSKNMPEILTEEGDSLEANDYFEISLPTGPNAGEIRTAHIHAIEHEVLHVRVDVMPSDDLGMGYFWFFRAVQRNILNPAPAPTPDPDPEKKPDIGQ